ncbi:uncharacterized protein PHACADRAFT_247416 [Phanerochaete carnosa HHB-10118-sp]|uniref:Uncharacterized protein n=1 Tax=Phanerochaete carnosa (strain HHB-10118-sp) TaxID=650164 RepID=K5WPA7_PHACS|nr:uncharacterized protein PHACADRAFT_247416 [Phanerochaete carnosa HHB-10118-sp]EKM61064.1 hypothetical protein PHACADRAFT_247416 [Phanerochaete carnosa HHB-10118-sp]
MDGFNPRIDPSHQRHTLPKGQIASLRLSNRSYSIVHKCPMSRANNVHFVECERSSCVCLPRPRGTRP